MGSTTTTSWTRYTIAASAIPGGVSLPTRTLTAKLTAAPQPNRSQGQGRFFSGRANKRQAASISRI